MLEENEVLRTSMRQPILPQDHQKKKRPHPSSKQVGHHKRLKVAQPEIDQIPDTSSMKSLMPSVGPEESLPAGPTELPPTPELDQVPDCSPVLQADEELLPAGALSSAHQSSRIAERTRHTAKQRWGNSHLRDKSPGSDCCGNSHWSEDEEDVNDHDLEAEGEEDMDDDKDMDDEENDKSDVTGISTWDQLGDSFEHEAASIGMSLAHESSILLTII